MRIVLSITALIIINGLVLNASIAEINAHKSSDLFSGQYLKVVIPTPAEHSIDPFDEKQDWTRSVSEASLQGATIKIINRELRLHLESYFHKGLLFR